jgi:hypothetical protein
MDQGVYALIAYPDRGDLQRIPNPAPQVNGAEYTAKIHLQSDGAGTVDVEDKYFGNANSLRHEFYRGRSQSEILKAFEERVTRYVNQATFRQASISGGEDSRQQISEKFSFSGNFSVATAGDSWIMQPLILGWLGVPELGSRTRQLPLDVGSPHHVRVEYHFELPIGMRAERLPEKTTAKSEFGEVSIEYAMNGDALVATQNVSLTESRIPPEKYAEFRDFVNAYLYVSRQSIRIVKASS